MTDCPNADVRDLLPDLVHGRLDAESRALVETHVAACADCKAEVALLRDLRASLRRSPRVDTAAIAAAVPAYRAPSRRAWVGWRTAAAITLLVAGGSSVVVMRRTNSVRVEQTTIASTPVLPSPAVNPVDGRGPLAPGASVSRAPEAASASPAPRVTASTAVIAHAPGAEGRELAMGGGSLNDLNDQELTSLLKDIEALDAVPSVEVDNLPLAPIAPSSPRRATP
ncbi:MAG: zf-HC2 domain-containing protein [bacterium]